MLQQQGQLKIIIVMLQPLESCCSSSVGIELQQHQVMLQQLGIVLQQWKIMLQQLGIVLQQCKIMLQQLGTVSQQHKIMLQQLGTMLQQLPCYACDIPSVTISQHIH
jgi:hypothetical protein